jgi:CO/xanthine dehydrogenase FAD-binding subunit
MIKKYYRPKTLDEALQLLAQADTLPLGGGTLLSKPGPDPVKVVDLQALGLNTIQKKGNNLECGATVTLQQLLESEGVPEALKIALRLEAPLNLRNAATVAGTLVAATGRSTFATALLAVDAKLTIVNPKSEIPFEHDVVYLGDFLPLRPENLRGKLITQIEFPLNAKLAFETVARTPADKPIVCAALAQWPSGRTRLVLGGYGKAPLLAMDGAESDSMEALISSIQAAARNTFHEAGDEWASAEYRMDVAAILVKRCLEKI